MTVVTHHIRQMLIAAADLAERVEQGHFPDGQVPAALERSANLAEHAGAELRDEMFARARRLGVRVRDTDDWRDPEHPPVDAIDLGGGVWASWGTSLNDGDQVLLWHWCDRSVTIANDQRDGISDRQAWWYEPKWVPAGGAGHDLITRDPLHLEPSVLWPSCCGKHGFVRDGRWAPA